LYWRSDDDIKQVVITTLFN